MSNKFCRFLSNGCSFQLDKDKLLVKPCCWYRQGIEFDPVSELPFKSINNWTPNCEVCYQQELAGQHSFRKASFEIIPEINNTVPLALDINLDMTCNAACVICGPESSSTWSKQMSNNKIIHIQANSDYQQYLDKIVSGLDLTQLKRIKFFGGEPLLTNTHLQLLEKIPYPEQCEIWYTTNASILPNQTVLDMWKQFKLVFVEASIDGVEQQFEYIRWPLPWSKIKNNLLELKDIAPVNVLFRINHTLNPFNIYYYDRLEHWIDTEFSTNRLGDPTEINIHPCWGDWALDRTPLNLREEIYKKYQDHIVTRLLKNSKQQHHDTILKFTDIWDPIRKNSWQTTFPEIVRYFL